MGTRKVSGRLSSATRASAANAVVAICALPNFETGGVDGGSMTPSQLAQISGIEVHKFAHPEMGCVSTDRMH